MINFVTSQQLHNANWQFSKLHRDHLHLWTSDICAFPLHATMIVYRYITFCPEDACFMALIWILAICEEQSLQVDWCLIHHMNSFSLLSATTVDNSGYVASPFRLLRPYVTSASTSIDMWVCNLYNVGTEIYYVCYLRCWFLRIIFRYFTFMSSP